MKELIEIPLVYRLLIVIAAGIILGNLANLIAFALSSRPGRSPWSQLHPHDAKSRWLDRLPILGWLRLSRKSEQLGRGFWVLPLLAELSMAALCGCLYWWEVERSMVLSGGQVAPGGKFAPSIYTWGVMHEEFAAHVVLAFFMLAATLIDFDERIIPDEITVPGTLIGLILAAVLPWTLMPVDVHLRPGIQYVEFMTLVYPDRSYGPAIMELDEWPAYLEAPKQTLPLIVAIAVYWFWCLSLLPWLWLPRRGFEKAVPERK